MLRSLFVSLTALSVACATTTRGGTEEPTDPSAEAAAEAAPAPVADPNAWRVQKPKPGAAPELILPVFQKATLKNGLTVLVSERHDLPLVAFSVAFLSGSAAEPAERAGIADLTYELLLEGAGNLDAIGLANAFADIGASPSVGTGYDGAQVGVRVLSRNADRALKLLADVVQRPKMAQADFDRKKKQQLADLALQVGDPNFLSREAVTAVVFGEGHPYGHVGSGTPKTVGALTLADAKDFYARKAGPKAAALIMTGDLTLAQATAWAEKHFGKWSGPAAAPALPPVPEISARTQVVLVPKDGLNQTIITFARPGLRAGHEDEFPLQLASTVFGGFFGSRLNMNLREAKGYSYGAYAAVDARRGTGPLFARSAVRADVTGASLTEFVKEFEGIKKKPITSVELEAAREGSIRAIPGMFQTNEGVAGAAASLFFEDQPLDRYSRMVDALKAANPVQVQTVAEKYLDPKVMRIILVGDPKLVRDQVSPLQLGTLIERTTVVGGATASAPPSVK